MNVLIAADYATPASGNFISSLVELGRMMKKQKHQLSFIFPENKNTIKDNSWIEWLRREGFTVRLLKQGEGEKAELEFLKNVIAQDAIDILHIHFGLFIDICRKYSKILGVKILIHDHMDFPVGSNLFAQHVKNSLRSVIYRKKGMAIVCVNPYKARTYLFARCWYVPNGLSFIRNVDRSMSREECRKAQGIKKDEKVCLVLGWNVYLKGIDIVVKAINEINKEGTKILLCIAGMGSPPDQERTEIITETTGINAFSSWIKYLPSREDMFAYHRAADVFVSASRSEAFSYGILEAISQNRPVVVSDIKGTKWCHMYNKALSYPSENYQMCADAIRKALAITDNESNAGEIVKKYSIKKWCRRIMQIYKLL